MLLGGSIYQSLVTNQRGIGIEGNFRLQGNFLVFDLSYQVSGAFYQGRTHWKLGTVY